MPLQLPTPAGYADWKAWAAALIRALNGQSGGSRLAQFTLPKRLAGPLRPTNAAADVYVAPDGARSTVRMIHVMNPTGAPVNFNLSVGADAAGTRIFDAFPIPANSYLTWVGQITLMAGEKLQAFSGTTNTLILTINGEETVTSA